MIEYTEKELTEYYEARFEMMASKGWKDLMADIQEMALATNDITAIQDEKSLHFRRGELSIIRWIMAIEQTSRDAFEDMKAEK